MIVTVQSVELICSVILSGCFGISILHKLRNFSKYIATITAFNLLPNLLVQPSAIAIIFAEILVIVLIVLERSLAFLLASVLLILFTIALASLIIRNMSVACNCFSHDQTPVGIRSICRNLCFIACSWAGAEATFGELIESSVVMSVAIALSLFWVKPGEIAGNVVRLFVSTAD